MQNQIFDVESTEKLKNKRNSGIFSFLKWFLSSSTSRDSIDSISTNNSLSGSTESVHSATSIGTLASFLYLSPALYAVPTEKRISVCPETNTYRARLKQCYSRREAEKNITLTKKYNLFTSDIKKTEVIFLDKKQDNELNNYNSLPLMTRKKTTKNIDIEHKNGQRRTNSDSFKNRKSCVYLHVKGKKKAPQPPILLKIDDNQSKNTFGLLRRKYNIKKNLAPLPPLQANATASNADLSPKENIESNKQNAQIMFNGSSKLDEGIIRSNKDTFLQFSSSTANNQISDSIQNSSNLSQPTFVKSNTPTDILIAVPPKPLHKLSSISSDIVTKNEKNRNAHVLIPTIKYNNKHNKKSGLLYLPNISQLDKEATEIYLKKDQNTNTAMKETPEFMGSRNGIFIKKNLEIYRNEQFCKQQKPAPELIAKVDDVTNMTTSKLNSNPLASNRNVQATAGKLQSIFHADSSSSIFELKSDFPPKIQEQTIDINENTTWFCKKCQTENDSWRIICYKCSAVKSYSKNLIMSSSLDSMIENTPEMDKTVDKSNVNPNSKNTKCKLSVLNTATSMNVLERSKTEIGFSVLTCHNKSTHAKTITKSNNVFASRDSSIKKDERERLKQMLIEMKNSLPNRKNIEFNRKSSIDEYPKTSSRDNTLEVEKEMKLVSETSHSYMKENKREREVPKSTELILLSSQIIYENIKLKSYANKQSKPLNVSTSVQTNAVVRRPFPTSIQDRILSVSKSNLSSTESYKSVYKDCENDSKNIANSTQHLIKPLNANAVNDNFIHLPKQENLSYGITEFLAPVAGATDVADTIEINRLLRKLEMAIAKGDLIQAAEYAQDLAQLKVNCSVVRQKNTQNIDEIYPKDEKTFMISLFVEDRLSHRGPFPIQVEADYTVLQLKELVAEIFEIPINIQKWILGRELAVNDSKTLQEYNVGNGCAVFLYLHTAVTSMIGSSQKRNKSIQNEDTESSRYGIELEHMNNWLPDNHTARNITTYLATRKLVILDKEQKNSNVAVLDTVSETQFNKSNFKEKDIPHRTEITRLSGQQSRTKLNEWACQICTLLNSESRNICGLCANVRTSGSATINHTGRENSNDIDAGSSRLHYQELIKLENADLIANNTSFECLICLHRIKNGAGVILRECLHQFCKSCLANAIEFCDNVEVKCPFRDDKYACDMALQIREIKALVTKSVYNQFLARSIKEAENKSQKSFHCRTPDCEGWCLYEDNVNQFRCPVCNIINCLTCQAIHEDMDCRQYQNELRTTFMDNEDIQRTRVMLDDMVRAGDALHCPACRVVLMKKWGCDWVRCTVCKTEICWVTRGARWGPRGKGDISGGCKCGVNGIKCHPHCSYCH